LKTGEVVEIAEGYYCASLSRSGKYLVYGSGLNKQIVTRNLETGETWTISERCKWHSLCITPDDKYVIYSESITGQLFQVPITGGTPVQLTIYEKSIGETRLHPSCSADGRWVLYENVNNTRISCPITQPDGSVNTYWFMQSGFFAFNLETKKSFKLFPVFDTAMPSTGGVFSPDGSQFAYILNDLQNWEYALYIHDFTPEALPDGTVTSIAEALPTGFAITGNHPNPFNPSTTISFGLPSSGTASLAVYDITGRKVRELAAGRMTAGAHSTVWDGRDASGRAVSSGVYFARLSIGGAATTHRMMLMK
jgi:Tol biopolymer transport system component